jgi:hypothetical protein
MHSLKNNVNYTSVFLWDLVSQTDKVLLILARGVCCGHRFGSNIKALLFSVDKKYAN